MRLTRYRLTCPKPAHGSDPSSSSRPRCTGRITADRHGMAVQSFHVAADGFLRDEGPAEFDDGNVWLEFYCTEGHSIDPDDLKPTDEDTDLVTRALEAGDAAVREAATIGGIPRSGIPAGSLPKPANVCPDCGSPSTTRDGNDRIRCTYCRTVRD